MYKIFVMTYKIPDLATKQENFLNSDLEQMGLKLVSASIIPLPVPHLEEGDPAIDVMYICETIPPRGEEDA